MPDCGTCAFTPPRPVPYGHAPLLPQVLDSKEYLAPIVTPHEAMLAFSPDAEWQDATYRLDFDGMLQVGAGAGGCLGLVGAGRNGRYTSSSVMEGCR